MSSLNYSDVFPKIFFVRDNFILFSYSVFKTVAHPDLYLHMADYVFDISTKLINQYGSYKLYIDCTGVTISGIERYKDFVSVVSNKGLENGTALLKNMSVVEIYNSPSFINQCLQIIIPLVDNNLWNKIKLMDK